MYILWNWLQDGQCSFSSILQWIHFGRPRRVIPLPVWESRVQTGERGWRHTQAFKHISLICVLDLILRTFLWVISWYASQNVLFSCLFYSSFLKMDLASFLISRACNNTSLANYFYWYASITFFKSLCLNIFRCFIHVLYRHVYNFYSHINAMMHGNLHIFFNDVAMVILFLNFKKINGFFLCTWIIYLKSYIFCYRYLSVECVDPNGLDIKDSKVTKMYQHVLKRFSQALFKV